VQRKIIDGKKSPPREESVAIGKSVGEGESNLSMPHFQEGGKKDNYLKMPY